MISYRSLILSKDTGVLRGLPFDLRSRRDRTNTACFGSLMAFTHTDRRLCFLILQSCSVNFFNRIKTIREKISKPIVQPFRFAAGQSNSPVSIWCQNDVVSTSMRRHHVALTLIRCHFYVMCLLRNRANQSGPIEHRI